MNLKNAARCSRRTFTAALAAGLAATTRAWRVKAAPPQAGLNAAAILKSEFITDQPPTTSSHASTVAETTAGTVVAAWFGGTAERHRDVVIWSSRLEANGWSVPTIIASGTEDGPDPWACWNPVLFQPRHGPLLLFYKVGPSPSEWWGRWQSSADGGVTWSRSHRIPAGFIGPVRNHPIELRDGALLCPASEEDAGWRVHMERFTGHIRGLDPWLRTPALNSTMDFGAIQPALIPWAHNRIQAVCRTRQKLVTELWSNDEGNHWSPMVRTELPNPNSAIDAVLLKEGFALLAHNPSDNARDPLVLSASANGTSWRQALVLDSGQPELSYPSISQAGNGLVHVTWTWNRTRIRHAVVDPWKLRNALVAPPKA